MDILDKAKELGLMIADSEEMKTLNRAEEVLESDEKSKMLLNEYKGLQMGIKRATEEDLGKDAIDLIRDRLFAKQKEINEYEVTKNFYEAKANFDKLMSTINSVIIHSITGEEPCSPSKCGSCGGGCK